MSDNELKPCPFCGGKVELIKTVNDGGRQPFDMYHVECVENKSSACHWLKCTTAAEAIDDWNTRPRESELEQQLAKREFKPIVESDFNPLGDFCKIIRRGYISIRWNCYSESVFVVYLNGTQFALTFDSLHKVNDFLYNQWLELGGVR